MMKAFFLALTFIASAAFAAETVVIDVPAGRSNRSDDHTVRFIINQTDGTARAELSVDRERESCRYNSNGDERCTTWHSHILGKTALIDGMKVVDKQVTFEDRVDCGKMGVSRIFKVPTFFMSGNCKLSVNRLKVDGVKRIQVRLITKE